MTPNYRILITKMADELDQCHQLLMDDRRQRHPLADHARALLAEPEAEGPTDEELASFLAERYRTRMENESPFGCPDFDGAKAKAARIADARAVLAKWGRHPAAPVAVPVLPGDAQIIEPAEHTLLVPVAQPVPLSEPPGPDDCDAEGRFWVGRSESEDWCADWTLATPEAAAVFYEFSSRTVWLPAHALPTPEATND